MSHNVLKTLNWPWLHNRNITITFAKNFDPFLLRKQFLKKRKLYIYNPETDNFERFYPSFKDRFRSLFLLLSFSIIIGLGIFFYIFFFVDSAPTEENLREQNGLLRGHYKQLDKRVSEIMSAVEEIQKRGDNFYRIIFQLDSGDFSDSDILKAQIYQPVLQTYNDSKLILSISEKLDIIENQIVAQSKKYDEIRDISVKFKDRITHIPSVLPLNIKDFSVASGFGERIDPILEVPKFHKGLDFAAPIGTPVYATADGKVEYAGDMSGYGNCIDINHGNSYITRYGHLSKIEVSNGQSVKKGQLIGLVGSSGKSTGPHLHYEVYFDGEAQNPVNYYFLDITPEQYDEMIHYAERAGHTMD